MSTIALERAGSKGAVPSKRLVRQPLRVALVVPPWYELPPSGYGGIEQMCTALADALVALGHEVTLFGAGLRTGTAAKFVSTFTEPQYRRLGQALPELIHVAKTNRLLDPDDFDVVHDHTNAGLLTAAGRPVPTVTTVHGCPSGELGDYLSSVNRAVALVAISHAQRRLRPELGWTATVHHGLAPTETAKRKPSPGPALWLARFCADKGADLAIRACRSANIPLVLAGKCTEPAERRYLDKVIVPMLNPRVQLIVNPDRRRCRQLMMAARSLLLPIRWEEPFGMVMIEAMAMGTPVVALNRGAVSEIVRHGETGLVCQDPAELPEALSRVLRLDPAACAEHVRTSFSAERMAHGYERVYRQLATLGRTSAGEGASLTAR